MFPFLLGSPPSLLCSLPCFLQLASSWPSFAPRPRHLGSFPVLSSGAARPSEEGECEACRANPALFWCSSLQATAEQIRLAQMISDHNDADFEEKVKQVSANPPGGRGQWQRAANAPGAGQEAAPWASLGHRDFQGLACLLSSAPEHKAQQHPEARSWEARLW